MSPRSVERSVRRTIRIELVFPRIPRSFPSLFLLLLCPLLRLLRCV